MLARGSGPLKLFASPWSAPAWMKSNKALTGQGYLLPEYYQAWANYFIKFLKEYEARGILFWGLTTPCDILKDKHKALLNINLAIKL